MSDLMSKYGYRYDSPFKSLPFIKIKSPNKTIDMGATPFYLNVIAHDTGKVHTLPPFSGQYNLGSKNYTEFRIDAQKNNITMNNRFQLGGLDCPEGYTKDETGNCVPDVGFDPTQYNHKGTPSIPMRNVNGQIVGGLSNNKPEFSANPMELKRKFGTPNIKNIVGLNLLSLGLSSVANNIEQGRQKTFALGQMNNPNFNGSFSKTMNDYGVDPYEQTGQLRQFAQLGGPIKLGKFLGSKLLKDNKTAVGKQLGLWAPFSNGSSQEVLDKAKIPYKEVDASSSNTFRDILPVPDNVAQMLAKTIYKDARMNNESLSDEQKNILWDVIQNARKRSGKTNGGTEYQDYGNIGYGTPDFFNDAFNKGKGNILSVAKNSLLNNGFKLASTIGRGRYWQDPKDPNIVYYTDIYDWNPHEKNFSGSNLYQKIRNSVRNNEDKNLDPTKNDNYRMNFKLDRRQIQGFKDRMKQLQNTDDEQFIQKQAAPIGKKGGYFQNGGRTPIITNDPNDPRLRAYNDSLSALKRGLHNMYSEYNIDPYKKLEFKRIGYVPYKDINVDIKGNRQGTISYEDNNEHFYNTKEKAYPGKIKPIGFNMHTPTKEFSGKSYNNPYDIIYSSVYKAPVQPVVYQKPVQSIKGSENPYLNKSEYNKKYPPIYLTNPKDPRIGQYAEKGNQYLYKKPEIGTIVKRDPKGFMPEFNQPDIQTPGAPTANMIPVMKVAAPQEKTNWSYTYPTGQYNEQKSVYFPNQASWESFIKDKKVNSQQGTDYGSALGYFQDGGEYKGPSIVEYLATKGYSGKKNFRKQLAEKYGVDDYNFSAKKNLELLSLLRKDNTQLNIYNKSFSPVSVDTIAKMHKDLEKKNAIITDKATPTPEVKPNIPVTDNIVTNIKPVVVNVPVNKSISAVIPNAPTIDPKENIFSKVGSIIGKGDRKPDIYSSVEVKDPDLLGYHRNKTAKELLSIKDYENQWNTNKKFDAAKLRDYYSLIRRNNLKSKINLSKTTLDYYYNNTQPESEKLIGDVYDNVEVSGPKKLEKNKQIKSLWDNFQSSMNSLGSGVTFAPGGFNPDGANDISEKAIVAGLGIFSPKYKNYAENWFLRAQAKTNPEDTTAVSRIQYPKNIKSDSLNILPSPIITGDTITDTNEKSFYAKRGVYHMPMVVDLNRVNLGTRSRGENKEVESAGVLFSTMGGTGTSKDSYDNRMINTLTEPQRLNDKRIYVGANKKGQVKIGYGSDFKGQDYSAGYYDASMVSGFVKNQDGSFKQSKEAYNKNHGFATLKQTDGKEIHTGLILSKLKDESNLYGRFAGGKAIIATPDFSKKIFVSGSAKSIEQALEKFKKDNKVEKVWYLHPDNGSQGRTYQTKDNKITKEDWNQFDWRDQIGGAGFYLKGRGYKLGGTFKKGGEFNPIDYLYNDDDENSGNPVEVAKTLARNIKRKRITEEDVDNDPGLDFLFSGMDARKYGYKNKNLRVQSNNGDNSLIANIGQGESGNDYFIGNPQKGQTAFGKYQFTDSAQKDAYDLVDGKTKYGSFDNYKKLFKTTPAIQEEAMQARIDRAKQVVGNNPIALALYHYAPKFGIMYKNGQLDLNKKPADYGVGTGVSNPTFMEYLKTHGFKEGGTYSVDFDVIKNLQKQGIKFKILD